MTEFKDRFEEARKAKKLSRRELGRLSGVHPNTLNRWASGETQNPQPDELKKVSEVLDVSYELLRTGIADLPQRSGITLATGNGKTLSAIRILSDEFNKSPFHILEAIRLGEGANILVLGQALQAILKALPSRGITLDDPKLAELLQRVLQRAMETETPPDEKMVLEELMKPIS